MIKNINGSQVVADIWFENEIPDIDDFSDFVINKLNLKVVKKDSYVFSPGETVVYILSESHFAVHTYPEYGYVGVDIYTCGGQDISKLKELVEENYSIKNIKYFEITRGNFS